VNADPVLMFVLHLTHHQKQHPLMSTIERSALHTISKEKSCAVYSFLPCFKLGNLVQTSFPLIHGTFTNHLQIWYKTL